MNKEKTILIVEDEVPLQNAIKAKLEKGGAKCVTARSDKQALDYMKDIKGISLVWLDHYLLGKTTGIDFVAKLKADPKMKKVPIIF